MLPGADTDILGGRRTSQLFDATEMNFDGVSFYHGADDEVEQARRDSVGSQLMMFGGTGD